MPRIAPLPPKQLEEQAEVWDLLGEMQKLAGFIPNSYATLARRPGILRATMGLAREVMGPGEISEEFKALVAFVSSRAAGCRFCQAHTSKTAQLRSASAERIAAAFDYETSPLFSPAERAALALARDASILPNAVTDAHFDELDCYYSDDQKVELLAVISFFGFMNRWNDSAGTELEKPSLEFADAVLRPLGWAPGHHAPSGSDSGEQEPQR
jgi:uncharacterized peroxidase-related enzyme